MYVYHALINALSAYMIHINVNTVSIYTRRAQSYENNLHKVLYGNTHTHLSYNNISMLSTLNHNTSWFNTNNHNTSIPHCSNRVRPPPPPPPTQHNKDTQADALSSSSRLSRVKGTNLASTADMRHFAHWIFSLY